MWVVTAIGPLAWADICGIIKNGRNLALTTPRLRWLPTRAHMSWPHQEG
jgi:hypothetical protein